LSEYERKQQYILGITVPLPPVIKIKLNWPDDPRRQNIDKPRLT